MHKTDQIRTKNMKVKETIKLQQKKIMHMYIYLKP